MMAGPLGCYRLRIDQVMMIWLKYLKFTLQAYLRQFADISIAPAVIQSILFCISLVLFGILFRIKEFRVVLFAAGHGHVRD